MHFAELFQTAAGKRVFNVLINGTTVLSNFDIFATAGAAFKAVVRDFTATANASGQIVINFNTVTDNATIEGIEIIPATPNTPPTIATAAAASPNPVTGEHGRSVGAGRRRRRRSQPDLHLGHDWHAAGSGHVQRQRHQRGEGDDRHLHRGRHLRPAGDRQGPGGPDDDQHGDRHRQSDADQHRPLAGEREIAPSATQQFTATARDQFGASLIAQPAFTWAVSGSGTVSASGLYTAAATAGGPFTVSAQSGSVSGTASVSVVVANAAPTIATAAAASPSPVTGSTTLLSVLGADDNGEANLIYTWATTGSPPAAVTFSANGTNAAKASTATFTKAGSYAFQVTVKDQGNLTVTSSVTVTVNPTLTSVVVSPASATVAARRRSSSPRPRATSSRPT